jgi:hypothetical protein
MVKLIHIWRNTSHFSTNFFINKTFKIMKIMIPEEFRKALNLAQDNFPSIDIEEYYDEPIKDVNNDSRSTAASLDAQAETIGRMRFKGDEDFLQIPLNAVLQCPQPSSNTKACILGIF